MNDTDMQLALRCKVDHTQQTKDLYAFVTSIRAGAKSQAFRNGLDEFVKHLDSPLLFWFLL